jgi:hypothetical protein
MSTDITVYEPLAVMPILDLQGAMVRRQAMVDFVKTILNEGVDFGTIPGTDKPTLLKPGAEKLTTFFGLSKRFEIMEKVEDWTGKDHGGEPFFYYLYRARLYRSDVLIAEADGSASSWESKYRYRWVGEFDVPAHLDKSTLTKRGGKMSEFTFAVEKAETGGKYGKPAAYWRQFQDAINNGTAMPVKKTSYAGKTMDAWEIDSTVYRVPNPDPADTVNTIQKMSQKRALIAATLLAVNASEFFTQDMEDFVDADYTVQAAPAPAPAPARIVTVEQPTTKPAQATNGKQAQGNGEAKELPGERVWADWSHVDHAIQWGLTTQVFDHENHARNAYAKCKTAANPATAKAMWQAWYLDVNRRIADKAAVLNANAAADEHADGYDDTDPVTEGDWLDQ